VIEIDPQGGKSARMFAAAPEWQAGDWYVARNAAWTEPFIDQITISCGSARRYVRHDVAGCGLVAAHAQINSDLLNRAVVNQ
jgi:hypothetical protein